MTILSIEEFNQKSRAGDSACEKIYQDRTVVAGLAFSVAQVEAAEHYCQKYTREKDGAICIIVREKSFLRVWSEISSGQQEPLKKQQDVSSSLSLTEETSKSSDNLLVVEEEFIDVCQTILTEYIGPVAPVICKKTLAKKPQLTRTQFVEILAKRISDPQQAQEFQQTLLNC